MEISDFRKRFVYLWKDNKKVAINYFFYALRRFLFLESYKEHNKLLKHIEVFSNLQRSKKEIIFNIVYNECNQSKIILPISDRGFSLDLIGNGIREPTEVDLMIRELKPNMNIVDIGANLGYYVMLEALITNGKIYAIEPNPEAINYLKKSIALNKYKNIKVMNIGVGERKGILPFYISKNWNWSRFTELLNGSKEDIVKIKKIEVKSLDNLFENKKIDLIRMDIEGYEKKVIESMNKILKKNPNIIIFMEFHANMFLTKEKKEIVDWIISNGFEIKYLSYSDKFKKMKVYSNVNPKKLIDLNSDYCLVLKKKDTINTENYSDFRNKVERM